MARRNRPRGKSESPTGPLASAPLASSIVNLVVADIVLRGAGALLQRRLDTVPLLGPARDDTMRQLVEERSLFTAVAVAGATRLAARSPVGLALVSAGLVTKMLYDRGKRIEAKRGRTPGGTRAPERPL